MNKSENWEVYLIKLEFLDILALEADYALCINGKMTKKIFLKKITYIN